MKYIPEDKGLEMLNYGSYKFTNEHLIYNNKNINQEIRWAEILSYKLVDSKHIVLFRKNKIEDTLIISETEMDKSDFIKVLNFIKERVKRQYTLKI